MPRKFIRVPRTCLHCGKTFAGIPAEIRRGGGKYCTRACYLDAAPNRAKPNRACERCGSMFYAKPGELRKGKGRYCSARCGYDANQHDGHTVLEANREIDPETGCWNWTASTSAGYGQLTIRGKKWTAPRLSAHLYLGFKPEYGLWVLHHCDNKLCFNPEHLYIGTHEDNTRDAVDRGRRRYLVGERHPRSILTEDDVRQIRTRSKQGASDSDLAKEFGVHSWTIHDVRTHRNWRHV